MCGRLSWWETEEEENKTVTETSDNSTPVTENS